jgi:hypothetical protein
MDTFLPPIEKPNGPIMKLAYYFTRRQFDKVLTPLKVHSARLPPAFGFGLNIHSDMRCDISKKK